MTLPSTGPWSRLRLRRTDILRDLVAESTFSVNQLIQPVFVVEGLGASEPVMGLGDTMRHGARAAIDAIAADLDAGVRHFMLFAIPAAKSERPTDARHLISAVSAIKNRFESDIHLWVDVCLCSATRHGHCALLDRDGGIDLGPTLEALARSAVAAANAGADGVAPSDMMDGRTAHIRAALDHAGHARVPILSYSTKFASHFYGPFRKAAAAAPTFGDRRHYQLDVRSRRDAIAASVRCAEEGADLLMVKPALTSLDLIGPITAATSKPVGAYQVSGEYASLIALAEANLVDFDAALLETWLVMRRAGASFIVAYGAQTRARDWALVTVHDELFARSVRTAPGGVHSPVRAFRGVGGTPRFMASAAGAHLVDVEGRRYIDFCQSFGPLLLGHKDEEVAAAAHAALDDGWSYGTAEPYSLAARRVDHDTRPMGRARSFRVVGDRSRHVRRARGPSRYGPTRDS